MTLGSNAFYAKCLSTAIFEPQSKLNQFDFCKFETE